MNAIGSSDWANALETDFYPARGALRGERHRFERTAQGSAAERKKVSP